MLSRRGLLAWIAVPTVLLVLPGTALAAQRFATPIGSGTACTQPSPCGLATAVNLASLGDEVIVAPGNYTNTPALTVPQAATVHGADGQPRPVISGAVGTALVTIPLGGTLRHLAIRQDGAGGSAVNATGGTLSDLALEDTQAEGTAALLGTGSSLSTSTALAGTAPGTGVDAGGLGVTLHNVTAWGSGVGGAGILAEVSSDVTGTNVIARAPGGDDISGTPTLVASNFGASPAPLLANPAAGDFHELSGSPTIDAGIPDPLAGLTDMDGDQRVLGAGQDIGADEYVAHPPAASTGDASGATVTGTVSPNGLPTSYRFDFGATPIYGSSTPATSAGSGSTPTAVSADLPDLTPGSIVHYRVVATNSDGQTAGIDRILVAPGTLPTTLPGPQLDTPHFTAVDVPTTAVVGQPVTITASGSDSNDPVNSFAIDFGDGPGYFAESACRLSPPDSAFTDGRQSSFSVPYTFTTAGVHTLQLTLGSGGCGRGGQTSTQTVQVNVLPAAKRSARVRASDAQVIAAAGCKNADTMPTAANTKAIEKSTLCLLNQVRRQNRLKPFRANKKLRKAGALHAGYMLRGRFFAHQGPGEPALGARFRKVKYRGGGGENLGVGAGMPYATPRGMVIAWMNSPVHRANILARAFHTIGISVTAQKPLPPPPVPGATYVTEFGTTKR